MAHCGFLDGFAQLAFSVLIPSWFASSFPEKFPGFSWPAAEEPGMRNFSGKEEAMNTSEYICA
eukprot:SAG31_NODE_2962_length_4846_cov_3.429956_5_plen_63_part_00